MCTPSPAPEPGHGRDPDAIRRGPRRAARHPVEGARAHAVRPAATGKRAVLIMANIHAGEVEGKEACQMLIREVALGDLAALLDSRCAGHPDVQRRRQRQARLQPPRQGARAGRRCAQRAVPRPQPRLHQARVPRGARAGRAAERVGPGAVRRHAHHQRLLPPRAGDLHAPAQPEQRPGGRDYMWGKLFPAVAATLKGATAGTACPTGSSPTRAPREGVGERHRRGALRDQLLGLRNRFAILDENYSYADFRTRVLVLVRIRQGDPRVHRRARRRYRGAGAPGRRRDDGTGSGSSRSPSSGSSIGCST